MAVAAGGWSVVKSDRRPRLARRVVPLGVALLVFMLSLALRLDGIDRYATADEGYWMQRSTRFGAALLRGDLVNTYRAGHPGVTVMWAGLLGIGPDRLGQFVPERYTRYEVLERSPGYLAAFSGARHAVAVLTSLLMTAAVMLSWRLLGGGSALAGGAILVLDPYVVGMTRLLHVDALLAPLMAVSVLAGLLYWTKVPHSGYLLLSAVTGGLALLTKAPAGFLPIFFGLICLVGAARRGGGAAPRVLMALVLWGIGAVAVYVLLFPALWVDPIGRVTALVQFVTLVGLQPHDGNFFLGNPVLEDPGPLYYLVVLPLRLSPLVALGVGLLVLRATDGENRHAVRWLLLYVGLFVLLMTLASKKFDRYMLPALMILDLVAGVGLWRLTPWLSRWLRGGGYLLVGLVIAVQVILLARVWPYPITYYNPLAGGPERARQVMMVGWGEGLEQAAEFLNGLPNAERLYVVSSYHHVLRPRFVGTTLAIAPYLRPGTGPTPTPDYVVVYVNAVQRRQVAPEVQRAQQIGEPVFVARINGLPYAWVHQIPRSGPPPAEALPDPEQEILEN